MDFLQNFQFILQIPSEILKNRNSIFEISFFIKSAPLRPNKNAVPGNSGNDAVCSRSR